MKIEKGDQVKTPSGQQGEVIDEEVYDRLLSSMSGNPRIQVRLDGSEETETFDQNELELLEKKPTLEKVFSALKNIKQQVNLKNIPNLPEKENGELCTHLGYFEEYIQEQNKLKKDLAISNLNFVEQVLEALKRTNSSASCWAELEDNFQKIRWWARYELTD